MSFRYICKLLLINILLFIGLIYGLSKIVFKWLDSYTNHSVYIKIPNISSLNLEQAITLLKKKNLQCDIDTTHYDPKYKPYKIFVYTPEAGDYVKPGRRIFIRANPNGLKSLFLPKILEINEHIARIKLHENNILVGKVIYVPNKKKGVVLKVLYKNHEIKSGNIIPYKSKVDLIIGNNYKNDILIPNVIGMDLISVKNLLKEKKILLGQITYKDSEDIQNAHVYLQEPNPGEIYNKEKPLNIWLSNFLQNEEKNSIPIIIKESTNSKPEVPLDEDIIIE